MHKIVILGASGGIGSAVSKKMSELGHNLVLGARNEVNLSILAGSLKSDFQVCDVTDESQVESFFSNASETGTIKGVALCVGSIILKPVHLMSHKEWRDTLDLNLTSAFFICKYAAKYMREGSVLLFSSAAAQIGLPNHECIAASKAGIEGLVRSAAATYSGRGLRFNAIAPGLVRTELSRKLLSTAAGEKTSISYHGLNRLGEPGDIAGLASWLLSDDSSWVTGQVYNVDGGLASVKKSNG